MSTSTKTGVPVLETPVTDDMVLKLLQRNHKERDVTFQNGLHNHFPHTLLSHYALGAPEKKLDREWIITSYLEPMPDYKKWDINEDNWRDHIGNRSYYHNYLTFFEKQIETHGMLPTVLRYAFDDATFDHFLSGAVHPIIHTAFGVEFNQPMVVAEGLGMMAGQTPQLGPLLTNLKDNSGEKRSMIDIYNMVHKDASLDDLIKKSDDHKAKTTVENAGDKIRAYISMWHVTEEPESIAEALQELYTASMHVYATTVFGPHTHHGDIAKEMKHMTIKPSEVRLDFFLLHILTSALAVRVLVPHLPPNRAVQMLKAHCAAALMWYIARGRPPLSPNSLRAYIPSSGELASFTKWEELSKWATLSDDSHVPKVVRSLRIGHDMYEHNSAAGEAESLWFKAAVLTLDHWIAMKKDWEMQAVGLSETWGHGH